MGSPWGALLGAVSAIARKVQRLGCRRLRLVVDGEVVYWALLVPSEADLEAHARFPGMPQRGMEGWLRVIIKMNGMLVEREVFRSYRGKGVWFVRQPNIHTYQAVHRNEEGVETVIGNYESFNEAFWAADRAAEEAHAEFAYEEEDPF